MLKLLLRGTALDLPENFNINLVYENPLLLNDRIPAVHSLTFDLPPTSHNLSLLGNPDRLASNRSFIEYQGFEILFGPVALLQGVLVVTKFDKVIKLFFRGSTYPDDVRSPLDEISQGRYELGPGDLTDPDFEDSEDFGYAYKELIENSLDYNENFALGPIRIKSEEWYDISSEDEYPTENTLASSWTMYFNYFNAKREDFMFIGSVNDYHGVSFPSPYVYHVLNNIFGSKLINNLFEEGDLSKLVLCNFFHPRYSFWRIGQLHGVLTDYLSIFQGYEPENHFDLESFSSSMEANELIKQVLKIACVTLYTRGDNFELVYNKDVIESTNQVNWTDKLIEELSISKKEGQSYSYGYSGISANPDIDGVSTEDTIKDMHDNIVPGDSEELSVLVTSTNQHFKVRKRPKADEMDPDRFTYEVQYGGYGGSSEGEFSMVSGLLPLDVAVHDYWWDQETEDPIVFSQWYVPEWEGDRQQRPLQPHIMIFHGLRSTLSQKDGAPGGTLDKYPFLSGHNVDSYGNKVSDISLQWEGEDGLINRFHREFKEWVEQDKIHAEGDFLLSATDLKNLDMSIKRHVKSKNFFIEKLEVTIFSNKIAPAQVNLVEAPYITGSTHFPWEISKAELQEFFVVGGEDSIPTQVCIAKGESKMYVLDADTNFLLEYTLPSGMMSRAKYVGFYDLTAIEPNPSGIHIDPGATKMLVSGPTKVHQFTISSGDITTAVKIGEYDFTAYDTGISAVRANESGDRLFVLGDVTNKIFEFSIPSWDITSPTYIEEASVGSFDIQPSDIFLKPDESHIYLLGFNTSKIYDLLLPGDISSIQLDDQLVLADPNPIAAGMHISSNGTKLYLAGHLNNSIHQYGM